jgi:hypothetical protein
LIRAAVDVCYTKAAFESTLRRQRPASGAVAQSSQHDGGRVVEIAWTPECFWRLFEATGSIWAYLIYRDLTDGECRWVLPILN